MELTDIQAIKKAAEAAHAYNESPAVLDWESMNLDPATVLELCRLAEIGQAHEARPDPLGEGLNSGDGVYRP